MIKRLPKEVEGKLRSGVAVPSLQQCVEELVLNSIDAGATCVGVRVDMDSLKLQVLDNGNGMSAEDMGFVGTRYYTSKCSCVEDLENLRWYGFRGEALASILSLASLVEISSRTKSTVKTHVKMFKNGQGMDVFEAETTRPSAGTTVIVCNLFYSMPVRRRRVDAVLESERIRHRLEAISLIHPSVSFTLRNDSTGVMMVQLSKANNTHHRFAQIHGSDRVKKLGEISHTHAPFEVSGYICREGHYNNSLQYLYVNGRLLLKTQLHKLLNFLLRRLSSSQHKGGSPDGHPGLRSPKSKRSQELHGVYVINIKCPYSDYDICLEPAKTLIEFKDWDGVLLCVEEAVKTFLTRECLLDVSEEDTGGTFKEEDNSGRDELPTTSSAAADYSIGVTLASESVHRAQSDVRVLEDGVCPDSDMTVCEEDESLKSQSEGCVGEDGDNEPQADLVQPEPSSSEERTFSEEENKTQMCFQNTTSTSYNVLSGDTSRENQFNNSIGLKTSRQQTDNHRDSITKNRKIHLSDPFIHQSLKTPCLAQMNKSVFLQPSVATTEDKSSDAVKNRISLISLHNKCSQRWQNSLAPVVPPKIPRMESSRSVSLWKESGSLDKFRRIFGKSSKKKLSLQNLTGSAETEGLTSRPSNWPVSQRHQQDVDDAPTQKSESQINLRSLRSLSSHTESITDENKINKSLAAKICHLKKHKPMGSTVSQKVSDTLSQGNTFLRVSDHDTQDSNNNDSSSDSAVICEPASGCDTSRQLAEETVEETSDDWLHHFDASVGKTVYVNRVTGLSKYEGPSTEETQVACTSDVTNMAVSVVSETGMEYRCYPFQMDLVLPFLPKSRTERVISSGHDGKDVDGELSTSLSSLYSKWNNPVFVRPPVVGVNISSGQADGLAVKIHNILFPYRFSKAMIQSMKVICQVDKKFLACLINTNDEEPAAQSQTEGNLLVLVDQHAAHERVRLENLIADSYVVDTDASEDKHLRSANISPPLEISVTEEELRLLRSCQTHFPSLGLEVTFSQATDPQIFVGKVPLCFMERESNEVKRGRPSVIKPIVEEYLREQTEILRSAGRVRATLPLTVLKVLASLACHGAVKFNHSLNRDECHSLVTALSSCRLPFQCAHGRPSIIPLVDFNHLDKDQKEPQKPNLQKLRRLHKSWELCGNK